MSALVSAKRRLPARGEAAIGAAKFANVRFVPIVLKKSFFADVPLVGLTGTCLMELVQAALNSRQDEGGNSSYIVNRAIALVMDRGPLGRSSFPGLPGIDKSQTDFEQLLHHMAG